MLSPKEHFSYSQYTLFKSSPKWYFLKYFCNKGYSGGYEYGRKVANSLEKGESPTAELKLLNTFIKKYPEMGYHIEVDFEGIKIVAEFDGFDKDLLHLGEYKTGEYKKSCIWTQARADKHIQITWYFFLVYIMTGKLLNKTVLHYIPVERIRDSQGKVISESILFDKIREFETKRSLADIARLSVDIKKVWKQIDKMGEDLLLNGFVEIKGKRYYKEELN